MDKIKRVIKNRKVQLAFFGLISAIALEFGFDISGLIAAFAG